MYLCVYIYIYVYTYIDPLQIILKGFHFELLHCCSCSCGGGSGDGAKPEG